MASFQAKSGFPFRHFIAAGDPGGMYKTSGNAFKKAACDDDLVVVMSGPRPGDSDTFVRLLEDIEDSWPLTGNTPEGGRAIVSMRKVGMNDKSWRVILSDFQSQSIGAEVVENAVLGRAIRPVAWDPTGCGRNDHLITGHRQKVLNTTVGRTLTWHPYEDERLISVSRAAIFKDLTNQIKNWQRSAKEQDEDGDLKSLAVEDIYWNLAPLDLNQKNKLDHLFLWGVGMTGWESNKLSTRAVAIVKQKPDTTDLEIVALHASLIATGSAQSLLPENPPELWYPHPEERASNLLFGFGQTPTSSKVPGFSGVISTLDGPSGKRDTILTWEQRDPGNPNQARLRLFRPNDNGQYEQVHEQNELGHFGRWSYSWGVEAVTFDDEMGKHNRVVFLDIYTGKYVFAECNLEGDPIMKPLSGESLSEVDGYLDSFWVGPGDGGGQLRRPHFVPIDYDQTGIQSQLVLYDARGYGAAVVKPVL